jgi:hypothetical protein
LTPEALWMKKIDTHDLGTSTMGTSINNYTVKWVSFMHKKNHISMNVSPELLIIDNKEW